MLDLVIRGGRVVLPDRVADVDVGVADGKFAAVGRRGELVASREVDAHDLIVFPGAIDPHVHIATQFGAAMTRDDFETATIPAAFGGTTTICEFAIPRDGETASTAIARRHQEATGRAAIDYAFHAVVTGHRFEDSLAELGSLRADGVGSVKVFSTYLDSVGIPMDKIHSVLSACAREDLLLLVHCETDSLIAAGITGQVAKGDLSPSAHARSRPQLAEVDAIRSVCDMASNLRAPVYIVHISTEAGMATIDDRKKAGSRVIAETCPQYLFLDESVYDRQDGELWVCSPPIRPSGDVAGLWTALSSGTVDIIGSDHNCFDRAQKSAGRLDFRTIPNGLPGIEFRLPLAVDSVLGGRLNWLQAAKLSAENAARALRIWPKKGAIAVGADADFVLIDAALKTDLGASHMATDYSPFAGLTTRGAVSQTWLRGTCVVRDGEFMAPGGGSYLGVPTLISLASQQGND